MSDIETKAEPVLAPMMLVGRPLSLTDDGVVTVAAWAFKTSVVIDHMTATRQPFFSPAQRKAFMYFLLPPIGVQLWLAQFHLHRARRGHFTTHYLRPRSAQLQHLEFYAVTFVAGQFGFQMLASRLVRRSSLDIELLEHDAIWDRHCVRSWPWNDDAENPRVTWPPLMHLDDAGLDRFAYRWSRVPL